MASSIPSMLAVAALAAAPPAVAQAPPPFALADLDFTAECEPNAAFERLLPMLFGARVEADPQVDGPVYDAVSGSTLHVLRLSRPASWHGLRLVEVRALNGIESGPSNLSLVFADAPERVRAVWNARGWDLPPAGAVRIVDDEGIRVAVGIETDGPLAAVTCSSD